MKRRGEGEGCKSPYIERENPIEYKNYRNLLSNLMKKSKQAYYNKCFEKNQNSIKNTWNEIQSLVCRKYVSSSAPTVLSCNNGNAITNPYDIANPFNYYFASVAETTKNNIKYSYKHFSDCLKPTSKEEIENIISSLRFYFFLKMKFQSNWQIC